MSASVPHVFLDTNTLLHYRRPDQIDWCAFLGADAVMLVVTPALIDELEAQKAYANRSRKLKDRANASIKWIAQYIECEEPVELRPGVKLLFVRESPMIDFAAHRLSRMVADDQLIASALQFRQETGAHIVFVSNDTGLRLKLQPRGLKGTAPPEDARLPEEMDDAEKEMAELRRELARHQSRRPKLFLTFQDGREFGRIRTIRTKLPKVVKASELVLPAHTLAAHSSESVADYARKLTIWKDEIELLSPCELQIGNSGTAEATDIAIDFTFTKFVKALSQDDFPKQPKRPRSPFDFDVDFSNIPNLRSIMEPRPAGKPYISKEGSLSFRIPQLVHNRTLKLHCFWWKFSASLSIQNFSAEYSITCVEAIDPISGTLNFVLENDEQ
jgi:hypothetical protein